ncbi:MAG TPA: alpha/beta fold hydrolase [Xanthomonadaceae bacterium]|nr:alpha/beta fold hydrolase [Xanthomonadaceae bacterium]
MRMVANLTDPGPLISTRTLLSHDGLALACDVTGPVDAARGGVVLAHGFGQTARAWRTTASALAQSGYHAVAADGRGHGRSQWNPAGVPYTLEQFLDDVRVLAASAPRPAWIGASMGGLLGLLAAGESAAPPFSALVLVDVTPRWEPAGVERIIGFMRAHPQGFESFDAAADAIAHYLPHRARRKSPDRLQGLLVRGPDDRLRWHWDPRLLQELADQAERWQDRLAAAAARLRLPTLLVSGGLSDLVSERTVAEFCRLAPHAGHARIDDATHMVAGDSNARFTGLILDFLNRTESARSRPRSCP